MRSYNNLTVYSICVLLFQEEGVDITANSLHPGLIATNIFAPNSGPGYCKYLVCLLLFASSSLNSTPSVHSIVYSFF